LKRKGEEDEDDNCYQELRMMYDDEKMRDPKGRYYSCAK
jgi:hypothetical protein